jgi:hypothetical protein
LGEWRKRKHIAVAQDEEEETHAHELKRRDSDSQDDSDSDGQSSTTLRLSQEDYAGDVPSWMGSAQKGSFMDFVTSVREELTVDVRYGFVHLALFYVVMNNMVWQYTDGEGLARLIEFRSSFCSASQTLALFSSSSQALR